METAENFQNKITLLAKINFLLLGLATLIGWNAVLSSIDFYSSKFPEYNISFIMLIPSFVATFIFSLFATYFSKIFTLNTRIIGSIIVMGICLIFLPLEANYFPNEFGFSLFVILNFIISAFIAIMQATCVGLAYIFPYEAMSLYNTGIGFSGILMSVLRIIYILAFKNTDDSTYVLYSIVIYFSSAVFFLILTLIIHIIFINSEYFKLLSQMLTRISFVIKGEDAKIDKTTSINEKYDALRKDEEQENQQHLLKKSKEERISPRNSESYLNDKHSKTNFFEVLFISFKAAWPYSILIAFLYLQTFALFPGVMLMKQVYGLDMTWNPVILVLLYNIFDTVGKYLGVLRIGFAKRKISLIVLFRLVFFATFLLNVQNKYELSFLTSDWFFIINIAFFALSNGYLTTAIFILGSEIFDKAQKKEKVGFMMSFMFNLGCIGGSLLALSFTGIN